jgi:hypothetical protein
MPSASPTRTRALLLPAGGQALAVVAAGRERATELTFVFYTPPETGDESSNHLAAIRSHTEAARAMRHTTLKMATVQNIYVPADSKPDGRGYGFAFIPAGAGAGTTLNPTDIC